MLPFDRRPWAKTLAKCVIALVLIGTAIYAFQIERERRLDWGERAILVLLLLTVIPPNVAIIRRKTPDLAKSRSLQDGPIPLV